jgi:hypothetical protein
MRKVAQVIALLSRKPSTNSIFAERFRRAKAHDWWAEYAPGSVRFETRSGGPEGSNPPTFTTSCGGSTLTAGLTVNPLILGSFDFDEGFLGGSPDCRAGVEIPGWRPLGRLESLSPILDTGRRSIRRAEDRRHQVGFIHGEGPLAHPLPFVYQGLKCPTFWDRQ